MIRFENTITPSPEQWQTIIMGARNPLNSWARSDSGTCMETLPCHICEKNRQTECNVTVKNGDFVIGPNDIGLMMRLRNAGTDHRKFMRMITVYVTITAPLYWWKEFDTYKIATVANSCSTMHTIHKKEFTLDDFSCEHLLGDSKDILCSTISTMNFYRNEYLSTKDKKYWWQMIQLLPTSYNQKRTVMLNYEVLANIYKSRKDHKLDEWHDFCDWIQDLPYSQLITGKEQKLEYADQPSLALGA